MSLENREFGGRLSLALTIGLLGALTAGDYFYNHHKTSPKPSPEANKILSSTFEPTAVEIGSAALTIMNKGADFIEKTDPNVKNGVIIHFHQVKNGTTFDLQVGMRQGSHQLNPNETYMIKVSESTPGILDAQRLILKNAENGLWTGQADTQSALSGNRHIDTTKMDPRSNPFKFEATESIIKPLINDAGITLYAAIPNPRQKAA